MMAAAFISKIVPAYWSRNDASKWKSIKNIQLRNTRTRLLVDRRTVTHPAFMESIVFLIFTRILDCMSAFESTARVPFSLVFTAALKAFSCSSRQQNDTQIAGKVWEHTHPWHCFDFYCTAEMRSTQIVCIWSHSWKSGNTCYLLVRRGVL